MEWAADAAKGVLHTSSRELDAITQQSVPQLCIGILLCELLDCGARAASMVVRGQQQQTAAALVEQAREQQSGWRQQLTRREQLMRRQPG